MAVKPEACPEADVPAPRAPKRETRVEARKNAARGCGLARRPDRMLKISLTPRPLKRVLSEGDNAPPAAAEAAGRDAGLFSAAC